MNSTWGGRVDTFSTYNRYNFIKILKLFCKYVGHVLFFFQYCRRWYAIKCFEVVEYKQCISKNGYEYCKSLLRDSDMKV